MPRLRFPFTWGAPSIDTVAVTPPPAPFWTKLAAVVQTWQAVRADVLPRFEHIYPQDVGAEQQFRRLPPPD